MISKRKYSSATIDIRNELLNWSYSSDKYINIIAPPFSSINVIIEVVYDYIYKDKKVLYITNESSNKLEIVEHLKEEGFKKYTYVKENSVYEDSTLVICNFNQIHNIKGHFAIVIFDDITDFPKCTKKEIVEIISRKSFSYDKCIYFGIESIFLKCKEIIIPVRSNYMPMVEPRFITTRIDLCKDIPFVAYDYIRWALKEGRNVVIYVPSYNSIKDLGRYLTNLRVDFKPRLLLDSINNRSEKEVDNFLLSKGTILITDDFFKDYFRTKDSDIMVFCSDNAVFSYKNLVYFCGKIRRGEKASKSEVILLTNSISKDMNLAKNITRDFNKEAWRKKYFQL